MKLLDIVHPAAKVLADISMSQDAEVRIYSAEGSVLLIQQCTQHATRGLHNVIFVLNIIQLFGSAGRGRYDHCCDPSGRVPEAVHTLHRGGCASAGDLFAPVHINHILHMIGVSKTEL